MKKHQSNVTGIEDQIIGMYAKGASTRNSTRFVSYKDLKKVTGDLKPIYKAATEEAALVELDRIEETWGTKYPLIIRSWRNKLGRARYVLQVSARDPKTNLHHQHHRKVILASSVKSLREKVSFLPMRPC